MYVIKGKQGLTKKIVEDLDVNSYTVIRALRGETHTVLARVIRTYALELGAKKFDLETLAD